MADTSRIESDISSDKEDEELLKEFTSEQGMTEEEKAKLVRKLDDMFSYAADHPSWIAGRKKMIQCFQYREGEQWTGAELAELEKRGQPDTVNNQISVVVNRLVGDLVNQRFRVGFIGRNGQQDDGISNLLSDIFLYVRQKNDLEFEERDMAEDGFTCGMGVLDVSVSFDDLLQPEIKVRQEDPLIVFPDPDGRRYDWNEDGRFVARAKWLSIDEAAELYPQAAPRIRAAGGIGSSPFGDGSSSAQLSGVDKFKGEHFVDEENQRLRIIEVQYKRTEREQILILATGATMPLSNKREAAALIRQAKELGIEHRVVDRLNTAISVGTYAAGILLEHKVTDHKYFSLVPYFAYRRKTGEPYSLITLALSMQDAINKRESKALHLLSTNQAVFEKSAVDDPQQIAIEKAKPDGLIQLRDGALAQGRFQVKENLELAASQYNMHRQAQADLFSIVGLDPRMGQSTGEIRSGAGLQRKFQEASKPVAALFDNIRRTRKLFARVLLDYVQKYFTAEKIVLITDNEGGAREVGIGAEALQRIKTGLYDVVVTEFEDDQSTQDEHYRILAETLPNLLQFPPVYTKMLLSASRIRNKAEIMQALDAQQGPPPIQPKMNLQANLDGLEPVERAGVWELVGRKDIADQVRAASPLTTQQTKGTVELTKEKMRGDQGDKKIMGDIVNTQQKEAKKNGDAV